MRKTFILLLFCLSGCVAGLKSGLPDYMILYNTELKINSADKPHDRISAELYNYTKRYTREKEGAPRYRLDLNYTTSEDKYAIQTNSIATRQKASINLDYILLNLDTNKVVSQRHIKRSGSYYIEDSTYSTYVAAEDELRNLASAVVDEMLLEIAVDLQ